MAKKKRVVARKAPVCDCGPSCGLWIPILVLLSGLLWLAEVVNLFSVFGNKEIYLPLIIILGTLGAIMHHQK